MNGVQTIENDEHIAQGLIHLGKACPRLKSIIGQLHDVPLRRTAPGFASLASIIISQQVSRQSADAIYGRMVQIISPLTAQNYVQCGESAWLEIGLSRPKQRTFLALCQALTDRSLDLDALAQMDAKSAMAEMTKVKGIGPWTAEVYLLFAVGHPDIFPAGDLALQEAACIAYQLNERPTEKHLRQMAESWAPWRGVAARLLWAYYAFEKGREVAP